MTSNEMTIDSTDSTQKSAAVEKKDQLPDSSDEQKIRDRAYQIYLQRGEQPGSELEDWLQAERELQHERLPSV